MFLRKSSDSNDDLSKSIEKALVPYKDFPQPGIVFRNIGPILRNPKLFGEITTRFADRYCNSNINAVVALEARGFIFGAALADRLGLPLVMIRKAGKLPGEVYQASYKKLYGEDTLIMEKDALQPGQRVIIIDDFYSTGGTLQAATELVQAAGAIVHEATFVINNKLVPNKIEFSFPIYSLCTLKSPEPEPVNMNSGP